MSKSAKSPAKSSTKAPSVSSKPISHIKAKGLELYSKHPATSSGNRPSLTKK